MDYEKHVVEPTIKNQETPRSPVASAEMKDFVAENVDAVKKVLEILTNKKPESDPVFSEYHTKLEQDMTKISLGLTMEDNGETIPIDWSTLSDTEKREIFFAYSQSLGKVLEVVRKSKTVPELKKTDVNRTIFGKTVDDLAECWQLAQQDPLLSPHDVLRIFTRYVNSKEAIEVTMTAHSAAKAAGLNDFESRELFIRYGVSEHEQTIFEFQKTKLEIQEAGIPEAWGVVIALRSGEKFVDQSLIKAGMIFNRLREVIKAEEFRTNPNAKISSNEEIDAVLADVYGNYDYGKFVILLKECEDITRANELIQHIKDEYDFRKANPLTDKERRQNSFAHTTGKANSQTEKSDALSQAILEETNR